MGWKLLDALELSGTVVTIDAMGCQRGIAEKIAARKADYILAVKENPGHLPEEIKDSLQMLAADAVAEEIDCGHGRVEQRTCSVIADLSLVEKAAEWASLQGLVRIEGGTLSQGNGQDRARDPILHHPSSARCGAAEPLHPPAPGHRKQTPLHPRRRLRRGP